MNEKFLKFDFTYQEKFCSNRTASNENSLALHGIEVFISPIVKRGFPIRNVDPKYFVNMKKGNKLMCLKENNMVSFN